MSNEPEPDWSQSDVWDEFQWEEAFKYSEHMTAKYFRLLCRFGDLPDAEKFIAQKLGDKNFFTLEEEGEDDLFPGLGEGWSDEEPEGDPPEGDREPVGPGDPLFYESMPVFSRARQISLGWCNVLASVLAQEDRAWGLSILLNMGRILSYLAMSVGDGMFERLDGSIAFAKRVLQQINKTLGELDAKGTDSPQYRSMFGLIREHLLETHDLVVDYIFDLRKRKQSPGFGDMPPDEI